MKFILKSFFNIIFIPDFTINDLNFDQEKFFKKYESCEYYKFIEPFNQGPYTHKFKLLNSDLEDVKISMSN